MVLMVHNSRCCCNGVWVTCVLSLPAGWVWFVRSWPTLAWRRACRASRRSGHSACTTLNSSSTTPTTWVTPAFLCVLSAPLCCFFLLNTLSPLQICPTCILCFTCVFSVTYVVYFLGQVCTACFVKVSVSVLALLVISSVTCCCHSSVLSPPLVCLWSILGFKRLLTFLICVETR